MLSDLTADRARVAEIAAQILNLQHTIAELRAEQAMTQERLDSYKYPVLTLPNEIVSEILVHSLPAYTVFRAPIGKDSPALLTGICRKWRQIALATPALWRVIAVCNSQIPIGQHLISRTPDIRMAAPVGVLPTFYPYERIHHLGARV
ncbi:hypothetical protein C8R45DRAFT_1100293 [Mycena sanguinolenta]|nr:hypothetical protein C8R45DRAFT_1100293 [Mycena sanguinolenta]